MYINKSGKRKTTKYTKSQNGTINIKPITK